MCSLWEEIKSPYNDCECNCKTLKRDNLIINYYTKKKKYPKTSIDLNYRTGIK